MITPGLGDDIQMMKAGIMEIADIFVVNKADLKNAEETAKSIEDMVSLFAAKEEEAGVLFSQLHQKGRGLQSFLSYRRTEGKRIETFQNYFTVKK